MEDERGFALTCTVPNRLVGGLIVPLPPPPHSASRHALTR